MKKLFIYIQAVVLYLAISNLEVSAQPFYFYSESVSSNYNKIYRINLHISEKDLFLESELNPLNFTCDNYQDWFFLLNRFGISIYQPESPTVIETIIPDSAYEIGIFAMIVTSDNYLFLSTQKYSTDYLMYLWEFNTSIFNTQTLSEIKKISTSINPSAFLSNDLNYIYQAEMDSSDERYIAKYSIALDSIITIKYFSEIQNQPQLFELGTRGKCLFGYEEEIGNQETINYFVYDIDNDDYYPEISFPFRSYGYLSPNGEYVILQKALWDTTKPSRENFNGEISLYRSTTGHLVKDFTLPPEGEILLFDSYPDDIYYLVNYETEPEVYNLTRPILNSMSPSLGFPSGAFPDYDQITVTLTGELFNDSSKVYFNGNQKAATYLSDSVITFPLLSFDIRVTGEYPVWVSSYGSISDTLYFSVVDTLPQSVTPVLNCVRNNGGGSFTAFFGYNNNNSKGVYIAPGSKNYFAPAPSNRNQPKIFLPGSHSNVFSVDFNGDNLTWYLDGSSVKANKKSTACP